MRRIGVLTAPDASDPEVQAWLSAFEEGLQNVRIEYRSGGGKQRHRSDGLSWWERRPTWSLPPAPLTFT